MLNLFSKVSKHPAKFSGHKSREREDMCLKLLLGFTFLTCPKGHVVLRVEASHSKSALYLVRYAWVFCNWKCNVFSLSLDLTRLPHWGVMLIYGWELLALNHHSDELGDHKHCDSGDKILIFHGTHMTHVYRVLWNYWWKAVTVSHNLAMFGDNSASGGTKYWVCHMTSKNHLIERSCNYWLYVTTLPTLY